MFPKLVFLGLMVACVLGYWARSRKMHPALLLLLTSAFVSRIYWDVSGITVRLEQLTAGLLFVGFAFELLRKKMTMRLDWRSGLIAGMLVLMVLSSSVSSPSPFFSLKKTLVYCPYVLAFLALTAFLDEPERRMKAWGVFYGAGAAAMAVSMAGFYLFLLGFDLGMVRVEWGSLWLRGTMVIPNILGSAAVVVLLIAFVRALWDQDLKRGPWIDLAVLTVATSCILMSYTRAAWVGAVLGILLATGLSIKKTSLGRLVLSLAVIAASAGLTYMATTRIKPRAPETGGEQSRGEFGERQLDRYWVQRDTDKVEYGKKFQGIIPKAAGSGGPGQSADGRRSLSSLRHRWNIIRTAMADWRSSPVIGRGTDTLILVNANKPEFYISSSLVTILHDWGLLGLSLFAAFLLLVMVGLWKAYRRSVEPAGQRMAATLIVVLISSMMMDQTATTIQLSIFWVLLAFYASAGTGSAGIKKASPPRES